MDVDESLDKEKLTTYETPDSGDVTVCEATALCADSMVAEDIEISSSASVSTCCMGHLCTLAPYEDADCTAGAVYTKDSSGFTADKGEVDWFTCDHACDLAPAFDIKDTTLPSLET